MTREEAIDLIRRSPFRHRIDEWAPLLRPSMTMHTTRVQLGDLAFGDSRIGGDPDLPEGFEWPRRRGRTQSSVAGGKYEVISNPWLHFIAQIRVTDLPSHADRELLPATGTLYFFYDCEGQPWGFDPKDRGAARVIYIPGDPTKWVRGSQIPEQQAAITSYPSRIEFSPSWTLPGSMSTDEAEWDSWFELKEQLGDTRGWRHRLLGHPDEVQNPMELECQLVSNGLNCGDAKGYDDPRRKQLEAGAADWQLLLQIDSDEEGPGWMWGDSGMIYFWIRKQELARADFDNIWLVLQCF